MLWRGVSLLWEIQIANAIWRVLYETKRHLGIKNPKVSWSLLRGIHTTELCVECYRSNKSPSAIKNHTWTLSLPRENPDSGAIWRVLYKVKRQCGIRNPTLSWSLPRDLNPQPTHYKCVALPIELRRHVFLTTAKALQGRKQYTLAVASLYFRGCSQQTLRGKRTSLSWTQYLVYNKVRLCANLFTH